MRMERQISPHARIPGFRLETVFGDIMHDLYLGVAGTAIASCIIELLEHGRLVQPSGAPFDEPQEALHAVKRDMKAWLRARGKHAPEHSFHTGIAREERQNQISGIVVQIQSCAHQDNDSLGCTFSCEVCST